MRCDRGWRSAVALLATAPALQAAPVLAAGATPVHFSYSAPPDCPGEVEFLDAIVRDGGTVVRARDGDPARSFAVTIEPSGARSGHLVVRELDGAEASRTIEGTRCDEVARSLAVLVALALGAASSAGQAATALDGNDANDPHHPAPPEVPMERVAIAPTPEPLDPPQPGMAARPPRWRLGTSIDGALGGGPSPGTDVGLALYVEVARDTPDLFAPSVRVGVVKTLDATVQSRVPAALASTVFDQVSLLGTPAVVSKVVGRVDACPWRLMAAQPWSTDALTAQACARADVGEVSAHSEAFLSAPPEIRRLWVAAGAMLRLRWTFPSWFVEGEGGVIFPVTRYRFLTESGGQFLPATEVPAASGAMGLGGGFFFL